MGFAYGRRSRIRLCHRHVRAGERYSSLRISSSTSSPRARANERSCPQTTNPHFCSTRSEAALSLMTPANSGLSSTRARNSRSAVVAIPRPQYLRPIQYPTCRAARTERDVRRFVRRRGLSASGLQDRSGASSSGSRTRCDPSHPSTRTRPCGGQSDRPSARRRSRSHSRRLRGV
jgi:hypothetical protein